MDQEKFEKVKNVFIEYTEKVKNYNVPQEIQLKLYGLYKQANFGDNNTPKPSILDFRGRAKWNAWNEQKNESKYNSMKRYILIVKTLIYTHKKV